MQLEDNKEIVIKVFDKDAPSITEKILEVFETYLKSSMQNNTNS